MPAKKESKERYIARRQRRVRELYIGEGLQPRAIAERLVKDGTIETTDESLASALRLVRSDCAAIRAETNDERAEDASPTVAVNEIDALERELGELRIEHARQKMMAEGELTENCARSGVSVISCANTTCETSGKHVSFIGPAVGMTTTNTPQGPIVAYKALWPAGVRQKASKDVTILAEKIKKIEVALVEKRSAVSKQPGKAADAAGGGDGDIFRVVMSGKSTEELIAFNINGGTEGPTN
jgi:hypothetical protein